jgi:hypothetical protein
MKHPHVSEALVLTKLDVTDTLYSIPQIHNLASISLPSLVMLTMSSMTMTEKTPMTLRSVHLPIPWT